MHPLVQIIVGVIIADFFIAFFHWLEDTYFSYCMNIPIIGKIAKENEMHHYFPRDIVSSSYLNNMSVTMPLSLAILLVIYAVFPRHVLKYKFLYGAMFIFGSIANILHRFNHMRDCECPWFIKLLYTCHILVDHAHHKQHHDDPSMKYGVVLPITNVILDTTHFWRGLELVIGAITGIKAKTKPPYKEYVDAVKYTQYHHDAKHNVCPKRLDQLELGVLQENLSRYYSCPL
jgi:hypothetical protein